MHFEINSANWMLDQDGCMYLIECNGIPVLYNAGAIPVLYDAGDAQPQALVMHGLRLYNHFYKENPTGAAVNDHDLIVEAL